MQLDQINRDLPGLIIDWYLQNKRDLPWRKNRDPYAVWLSEIMLQQTRVDTVIPYYERFLWELPTIGALAATSEERLYKLWEGLGYYSRARNLKKAAEKITREYDGHFPAEYGQMIKLPGIGPYTAGAIASICFDARTPAVDGNVLRVVARIQGLTEDISQPAVKKEITHGLARIYPDSDCGSFTQGLMELGATVCVPNGKPKCAECPVKGICKAFRDQTTGEIPFKKPAQKRRRENITVLVLACDGKFAIRKRTEGLLAGLWEFPSFAGRMTQKQAESLAAELCCEPEKIVKTAEKTHIFTHIEWRMRFYLIFCKSAPEPFVWATEAELQGQYPMPAAFRMAGFLAEG